jgi:ribosomal-protein-alanine N-acetyltransferase
MRSVEAVWGHALQLDSDEIGGMITERLELIPATVDLCAAEAEGPQAVGRALGVGVPASWPPPVLEPDDVQRLRLQLERDPAGQGWTLHYVVLRDPLAGGRRELVGVAGYAGPPSAEGAVEVGYAIAAEHQRQGYATEAVRILVATAFRHPQVAVVAATTYAALEPSIGVLKKTGFTLVSRDPVTELLRFECRREAASGSASSHPVTR